MQSEALPLAIDPGAACNQDRFSAPDLPLVFVQNFFLLPVDIQDDHGLSDEEVSHIIGMAWEDDVPFEAIEARYGLDEETVVALMRSRLKRSSWELWRKRVSGRPTKHASRRSLTDSVSRRPPGARSPEPFDEAGNPLDVPDPSSLSDRPSGPTDSANALDREDAEQEEKDIKEEG